MSYDRQTDAIVTGSLNLLPASNLIPPEDAISLMDWRVDQYGALRTRLDMVQVMTIGSGAHTLHRRGANRYAGAGGTLYRDGASIATGFDGQRLGLSNFGGFCYIMNQAKQVRDDGSAVTSWGLPAATDAPTVEATAGGTLVIGKVYTYYVTFLNALGEESNPSPGVNFSPDDPHQWATVTRPASPDSSYTHWCLYRIGNTLDNAYRVDPAPYPISETIAGHDPALNTDDGGFIPNGEDVDNHTDVSLERLGIALQTDRDPPPAASGLAGPYFDRLLAYRGAGNKSNWLWWSKQLEMWAWPGADLDEGNHLPVGEDGEAILRVILHPRQARIYKERSLWRLAGDPDDPNSSLEKVDEIIGLASEKAIASAGDLDYFEGPEGIYVSNGYNAKKLSAKLDPLFKGDPLPANCDLPTMNLSARSNNTLVVANGRLYWSYAATGATTPSITLVYDIETQRWTIDSRGWDALFFEGQGLNLLGGAGTGVYALEQQEMTATLTPIYQSGYRDQGKRDHQKTYADVVVEHSVVTGDETALGVHAYYDDNLSNEYPGGIRVVTATPPASGRARTMFPLGGEDKKGHMARNCSIRIEGGTLKPVELYSIELHYYLEARDALTFDTAPTHLGHQGVKSIDLIEFDIDASGDVHLSLNSDRPGGTMNENDTATLTATAGRMSVQYVVDPVVDGRLVRIILTAATAATFRLYGCRVRYRPIGMFIDGVNGEFYATPELRAA